MSHWYYREPRSRRGSIPRAANRVNVRTLIDQVVADLRAIPVRLSGEDSPLADPWEEIKEQVHGELWTCWPAYLEAIQGTIEYEVAKLSEAELLSLSVDLKAPAQNRPKLRQALLRRLMARARREKNAYGPFDLEYFCYFFVGYSYRSDRLR